MKFPLSEIAPNLQQRADGVWVPPRRIAVSYPSAGNELCFAVENNSWWFQHRNRCIRELMRNFPPPGTLFDIGGGNGYVSQMLAQSGFDVVLVEPGDRGVRHAQTRGIRHIIQASMQDVQFAPGSLAAVSLFDVLEHIEDHALFLHNLSALQPSGGRLYLSVPALPILWSHQDELAGHFRRYRLPDLVKRLESAQYAIEYASYFFSFLVLPVFLRRAIPSRLGFVRKTETAASVRAVHTLPEKAKNIFDWFAHRELARIRANRKLHYGASCLLVARKS